MSAAAKLLDRLERVKQTAPERWIARCPAHQDRSPSLSIRELDDGRILLHDFGGCETADVLAALGLQLCDLFARPLGNFPPSQSRIAARDLLEILSEEITLVTLLAVDFVERRAISETDWRRLALAAKRINRARDHIHGR